MEDPGNQALPNDYEKIWRDSAGIKPFFLIHATAGYIVWLDNALDVDWQTTETHDTKLDVAVPVKEQHEVLNYAAYVNTIPIEHLSLDKRRNFRIMVGTGFARLFALDAKSALEMLRHAEAFAKARNAEVARGWQVIAVVLPAGIATAILSFLWTNRTDVISALGPLAFALSIGFCGGAIGAAFSVLSRDGSLVLDPSAGRKLHFIEGFSRTLAGAIGAVIAQLAVKLSIIFGFFEKGLPALFFIAIVAGVSERLVPTLIKNAETDASPSKKESS